MGVWVKHSEPSMNIKKKAFDGRFPLQMSVVRIEYFSSQDPDLVNIRYNPKHRLSKSQVDLMLRKMCGSSELEKVPKPLFPSIGTSKPTKKPRTQRFNPYFQTTPLPNTISPPSLNTNSGTPTDLEGVLISLSLHKYIDVFKEQEVEVCDLTKLNDHDLMTLIPKIGPRARLRHFICHNIKT